MDRKTWAVVLIMAVTAPQATGQIKTEGKASYYADMLHGHTMSNGQPYNKYDMTCAHLHYPLGTRLKVKNLRNGKEVIVKVTDRGPHAKRYILDLSRAAAEELDFILAGFAPVEITVVSDVRIPYRNTDEHPWTEWSDEHVPISLIYEPYGTGTPHLLRQMPKRNRQPVFRQGKLPPGDTVPDVQAEEEKTKTRQTKR